MAKGGYRPNAGRPKGSKTVKSAGQTAAALRQQPLEYLLGVMNDPSASVELRLRAAGIAAPFMHAKPAPTPPIGKKAQAEIDARTTEKGSAWEGLLPDYGILPALPSATPSSEEWDELLNRPPIGGKN